MSTELAERQAKGTAERFWEQSNNNAPFGVNEETGEEYSAYDFLETDALDWEYRIGRDGEYRSAHVLVGFGGPNIWIDTATRTLDVYWDGHAVETLPSSLTDALDEALEELWAMR